MESNNLIKNLIKIALYTSPVIGALIVFPIFMRVQFPVWTFLKAMLFATFVLLIIWSINIFLVYVSENQPIKKIVKKFRYPISFLLTISISATLILFSKSFFPLFPDTPNPSMPKPPEEPNFAPVILCFFLNTIIIIIQEIVLLKNKKTQIELENAQLRIKNAEAYYQQLQQQIHPHFLFNSLSILKTLIKKNPDTAEDYLGKLSDFLRASFSSSESNTVKLLEELKMCLDYLEMQKLRFGESLEFTINVPVDIKLSGFVPVFSIQLLIENAIKHNSFTNESPLKIDITYHDGMIRVCNNIQPKLSHEATTGLGLANLSERYKILSGSDIIVKSNDKQFRVSIKILSK